jgi:hypothetical protein
MNSPPPRIIRNVQVSHSAITHKNNGPKTSTTASTVPATTASTTSRISHTNNNEDNDTGMQHLKRELGAIDQERIHFKTQQKKVEDDVSTLTQSMTKMGGDI